ncbi:MAG: ABC transporter permease [Lewinellaceae bacterium]|nr:ABC transporter permease [Lewinellaceae bacterium]
MKRLAPVLFLCFAVAPLAAGLVYALLYSLGLVGALSSGFTPVYWQKTLTDGSFWASLGLSAAVATVVVLLSTALALLLLVWLRPLAERPRTRFLLHFPLAIPPIIAAFVSFQWLGSSGMLARIAYLFGWIAHPDAFPPLINDPFYLGVGLTSMLLTFPFLLLLFLNHYQAANLLQLSQLASTLGASPAHINLRLVWPVLLRRTMPTLLLYGVFLFGAYEVPLLLGRQNPAMLSVFISQKFSKFNLADLPVAYVATVVYALVVVVFTAVFLQLNKSTRQTHL